MAVDKFNFLKNPKAYDYKSEDSSIQKVDSYENEDGDRGVDSDDSSLTDDEFLLKMLEKIKKQTRLVTKQMITDGAIPADTKPDSAEYLKLYILENKNKT